MKGDLLQRQAYLDNELTIADMKAYEESLRPSELDELKAEIAFEEALSNRLRSTGPKCPDDLWKGLKQKMQAELQTMEVSMTSATTTNATPKKFSFLSPRILGLAAAIVLNFVLLGVIVMQFRGVRLPTDQFAVFNDLQRFSQAVAITGNHAELCSSLEEHGFKTVAMDVAHTSHRLKPLGIRYRRVHGAEVAQVYFNCCGKPVMAIISPRDADVQLDNLPLKKMDNFHIDSKFVGSYRVLVAGPHPGDAVLKLFHSKSTSI